MQVGQFRLVKRDKCLLCHSSTKELEALRKIAEAAQGVLDTWGHMDMRPALEHLNIVMREAKETK